MIIFRLLVAGTCFVLAVLATFVFVMLGAAFAADLRANPPRFGGRDTIVVVIVMPTPQALLSPVFAPAVYSPSPVVGGAALEAFALPAVSAPLAPLAPLIAPGAICHPSYPTLCLSPTAGDLDCGEIAASNFTVLDPDPFGLDRDRDGIGCER